MSTAAAGPVSEARGSGSGTIGMHRLLASAHPV